MLRNLLEKLLDTSTVVSSVQFYLPEPILQDIFSYLDPITLFSVQLVCKYFHRVSSDSRLWKPCVVTAFGKVYLDKAERQNISPKEAYQQILGILKLNVYFIRYLQKLRNLPFFSLYTKRRPRITFSFTLPLHMNVLG